MNNIKHIHLIAACGVGMGSLAGLLRSQGYHISGSDQNVYPPMSTELEKLGVKLSSGYNAANLNPKPDLVIIGNAVSKDNPEVVEVIKLGIPYLSMPQALSQFFISSKKSVVVAGTHGKTTTSALISHLLIELGQDPSFFVGGVLANYDCNYRDGKGAHFVVEGDEYDTAFFDKGPKFLHYQPYYTIITSLEFDHADIYNDIEHLARAFSNLIEKINPAGLLLACEHYPKLKEILPQSIVKTQTYGIDCGQWQARNIEFHAPTLSFDIFYEGKKEIRLTSPLPGKHNVLNTLSAYALIKNLGINTEKFGEALLSFKGVKRRQEVRGIVNGITVIDDFAHHPTAVVETIDAIRNKYPNQKLWAVFEPRSNSSKRDVFQKDYAVSFNGADEVIIADVFMPEKVKSGLVLNTDTLAQNIAKQGTKARHISGVDKIVETLTAEAKGPATILIMSNGGFGGIHAKLLDALKSI